MNFSTRNVEVVSSIKLIKSSDHAGLTDGSGGFPRLLLREDRGEVKGAVCPTTRGARSFKVQRSVKVPHADSTQLRKVAARARADRALGNHAGSRYHDRVAAAAGPNSNRYEPVRLFILRGAAVARRWRRGAAQGRQLVASPRERRGGRTGGGATRRGSHSATPWAC